MSNMSKIINIPGKIRKVHPAFCKENRRNYLSNTDTKSPQKENTVNLDQDVRNAVDLMVASQQAFTTVDISHPIIAKDSNIRHRNIRDIINKMLNDGEFESAGYTTSMITVYPQPGSPQTARLFHPDDPNFDPNSYTSIQQELNRNQSPSPVGRQINISDGDGDDNQVAVTSTPSGNPVTVQCQIQNIKNILNIPRYLIKRAGFGSGDHFTVTNSNHNNGNSIRIQKSPSGSQTVDIEGRIRIYNPNLKLLNKDKGQTVNAVLVNSAGDNYIEIF